MDLQLTSSDAIPAIAKAARLAFLSQKTRSLDFRLTQLRKLYWRSADFPRHLLDTEADQTSEEKHQRQCRGD